MTQPQIKTDIEARVKDTGDTMTGNLTIKKDTSSMCFQNNPLSKTGLLKLFNNGTFQIYTTDSQEDNIWLGTNTAQLLLYSPDVQSDIKKRFLVGWGDQAYGVYHTGNKPTTNDITYLGRNLTTVDTDTVDFWKSLGSGHAMIDTTEVLAEQPYQWCWLENRVYADWVIQELHGANQKSIWRRYGLVGRNNNKFEGTPMWKEMLDSANYNKYALPLSGGTLTGQLKANKNISIINTNPWILLNDTDVGYDFYIQASGSLLGLGRGWENSLLINTAGQITLQTKTSIADNTPAGIFFHITQTDNNITTKSAFIKVYDDHDAQSYGTTMVIQSAGNMVIGSGEAPNACYTTDLVNSTTENTYIVSDSNIYFYTKCNTYANKKTSVYINTSGVLYGAAWNDYAEYRESVVPVQAGRCVKELGNGKLQQTQSRLEPGCLIVSDTFGYAIGQTEICQTPIAVSGRVLAYPAEDRNSYSPGDAVCSGPNGTVSKMTRKEIMFYPERIIGTVSEIPEYETWGEGNVPVDDRIWISIK